MKRFLGFFVVLSIVFGISACTVKDKTGSKNYGKVTVAVSIMPQKTFVEKVAGDSVNVVVMIPPGYSPANYQPTAKQMIELSKAKVYFSIGVPAESSSILPKLKGLNRDIKIIYLSDIVEQYYPLRYFNKKAGSKDPHIWMSPKRVKVMIRSIKDELTKLNPKNKEFYKSNAEAYIKELDELDQEIKNILAGVEQQSFIIYHPSFGYFADDYGLKMVTIEEEGKKATPKRIQEVINFARKNGIKFVFYQEEFDSQQAKTISKEIGGVAIKVVPLSPYYIENLKTIAKEFKKVLEK